MCPPFQSRRERKPRVTEAGPGAVAQTEDSEGIPLASNISTLPKHVVTATHSDSPSHVEQQPQIPAVPESLPSQVDKTLAECPKFRIVLIGNSGVGKSSLIKSIFNIDPDQIDIAHNHVGDANIEREYMSSENPRFILHDSKGFEVGSKVNWDTVEQFLQKRWQCKLPEKIHAIWFCVETPLEGGRLLQTGDESLLKLAKKFNIPIIAVFTKYDQLVTEFWRQGQPGKSEQEKNDDAEKNASDAFDRSVKELQEEWVKAPTDLLIHCVKVSTIDHSAGQMLIDLTNKTRILLHKVEDKLQVLWVTAQQVNALQKVEVSISEGFKQYWRNLGESSAFEDQILIDCIHRIHDDVLKVWNFNDPTKILSGTKFFTEIIGLIKPLIDDHVKIIPLPTEPVSGYGTTGATVLVPLLRKFGFGLQAVQYLCGNYKKYPSTAKLLATYIINLILAMYRLFADILSADPPRALEDAFVFSILARHKAYLDNINTAPEFATHPERVIKNVIREQLKLLDESAGSAV